MAAVFILFVPPKHGETVPIPVGVYDDMGAAEEWIIENVGFSTTKFTSLKIEAEDEWVTLRNTLQTWEVKANGEIFQIALVNSERTR